MIPHATGLAAAALSAVRVSGTPAFASANSGTTTKLVHGSRRCSTRAIGETASLREPREAEPRCGVRVGWVGVVARVVGDPTGLLAHRRRVAGRARDGISSPSTTPAIVGCTPAR